MGGGTLLGRVVEAPDVFRAPDGDYRQRIDDPLTEPITKGDRIFGWEGDNRYRLYANYRAGRWELWRHEDDGVMRCSVEVPGFVGTLDIVPWLVQWLVTHDGRRGYDPVLDVLARNAALDADKQRAATARNEEAADRLHHALLKDIGHLEGGLTRRIH